MKLYGYFRSSTTYRLRIALELKGIEYEYFPVDLLASEQKSDIYTSRNPFGSVPLLVADGRDRAQSMAQLEWLDEAYPENPLLPADLETRFSVRELAYAIATETHAPNNLPVLKYLQTNFDASQPQLDDWYRHWLTRTFDPVEARLAQHGSQDFLLETPGLFEVLLLPQMYNARRFSMDMGNYPHMTRIEEACLALPAFQRAHPDNQVDAPKPDSA
ncbi:maleylacetoacetate isomerase [Altererythrobacter lutimaris]|uniref:Maleylacetoacetate isomerase n=1 Tax=Altererythrobacter lutimaris TaxID=2743979 RepID=A0A850H8G6_9SPHN|nr:maleylacetoacetate isomerase [Altererythrobacter lutimaris]NVE93515.1 maleylacetoacetate isomerase [Altererythrobacter lutimaris]